MLTRPKGGIGVPFPYLSLRTVASVHLCRVLLVLLGAVEILPIYWNCVLR